MPAHFADLTGHTFGWLRVIEQAEPGFNEARQSLWKCECRCGEVITARGSDLTAGSKRKCGYASVRNAMPSERQLRAFFDAKFKPKNKTNQTLVGARIVNVYKAFLHSGQFSGTKKMRRPAQRKRLRKATRVLARRHPKAWGSSPVPDLADSDAGFESEPAAKQDRAWLKAIVARLAVVAAILR
jgi:hypothetical protein